ncbi:GyrI-like domain-containing protein [Enterococcus sp. ZJ1622]|uniref:GyrI-like domain-containing protein n=1 Tax=Enterococcus sp. ZJ1622 TaxID=2709401 RepID=UPI0013EA3656|nr:GyrI-like domain-containing protein [Enterococcus sp. ZJ1622]
MEKIEWRKSDPSYSAKKKPQILELPTQQFFSIKGIGDPNQEDFQRRVACLYAVSYTIRMAPKKDWQIPGYLPYTVYPLEGQWGLQEKFLQEKVMKKEHFSYQLMIRQPDFVTEDIAQEALVRAAAKLPADLADQVEFLSIEEGRVAQILHIGPYDDEPETFEKLEMFIQQEGHERLSKEHKEIYLSDPRKAVPEKMKTILRVAID